MALTDLAREPHFSRTRLVVIDFESLTPAGRPPEPIEVAAVALACSADGTLIQTTRFYELMRPPADVPMTWRDQSTGITAAMLAQARPTAHVMADLDGLLTTPPYRLVAHNAATENNLIAGQREHCPVLATTPLLDTVRLARKVWPELSHHNLDALLWHLDIPVPLERHRAMADVELTVVILQRLLDKGPWSSLHELERDARVEPKHPPSPAVDQESLF